MRRLLDIAGTIVVGAAFAVLCVIMAPFLMVWCVYTNWKESTL